MYPNYYTEQILQRYCHPANNSVSVDINKFNELIDELSHVFESPKQFNAAVFQNFPIEFIVDYIRRTHRLYLFTKLPEIEQSIYLLLQDYSDEHPLLNILMDFYSSYKIELSLHICEEEQHLLPYVDFLLSMHKKGIDAFQFFKNNKRFSLIEFENDHHDDSEKNLKQIQQTILAYDPPFTNITPYRILLHQLQNLERDLCIHGLIEDRVLLPGIKMVEAELLNDYRKIFKRN
jgi:regulator of cell morphogenesis and NO signaling